MARVIVFGTTDTAQLAEYYLRTDSPHEVVAFTVDGAYRDRDEFLGRPVVPFEDLVGSHSPDDFRLFTPMVALQMNKVRQRVYQSGRDKGFRFVNYISSRATVLTEDIGENNFILEDNTIQPFQSIGDNNVLWSGNHIGHHGRIGNHVLFTSHVVLSGHCDVGDNCFLGVNSTIRDGIRLGEGTLVAMGASILKDTDPWTAWIGNPARKHEKSSLELYR